MSFIKRTAATVVTIAAIALSPAFVLAQNWTPPTQAPTGGNVPSPVNVGPDEQTKQGALSIGGVFKTLAGSFFRGTSVIEPDANDNGVLINFLKAYNYNNAYFGSSSSFNLNSVITPVDLSLYGRFKYEQADTNGNPVPITAGHVLTTDAEGYAKWTDPATIIGGGTGNLPPGTQQGDSLYWDMTGNPDQWKPGSNVKINPTPTTAFRVAGSAGDFSVNGAGEAYADKLSIGQELKLTLDNSPNPVFGQVLTLRPDGTTGWNNALPPGGNVGDTLIWNGTTWVTNNVNNNGTNLPQGTVGQTLRWNGTAWDKTSLWLEGTETAPAKVGTDNTLVEQVALSTTLGTNSWVNLSSPAIRIFPTNTAPQPGHILTATDATGKVAWSDPSSVASSILPPGTDNYTMRYNADLPGWEQTNEITIDDDDDITRIGVPGVTSEVNLQAYNAITLDNEDVDTGRFLSSADTHGKVNWNKYFIYEDQIVGSYHYDKIVIPELNEANRSSAFVNYGAMTYLDKDLKVNGWSQFSGPVVIDNNGSLRVEDTTVNLTQNAKLYIENVSQPMYNVTVEPLCRNTETGLVMGCDPIGSGTTPGPNTGDTTVTYGLNDNDESIHFNEDATLDIKWCGGGGGGGAGGLGMPFQDSDGDQIPGYGGGGGGGGAAGVCEEGTFDFTAGQVLSWNIGAGGEGGSNGIINILGTASVFMPTSGLAGQASYLLLNGAGFNGVAYGGQGGLRGCSSSSLGDGVTQCTSLNSNTGGLWGSPGGNYTALDDWHDGESGRGQGFSCPGCGGAGGDGESENGPNPTLAQGSSGGAGGTQSSTSFSGGYGYDGSLPGSGGGGGGGTFGRFNEMIAFDPTMSGRGGDGAPGYVQVTGPANILNNTNSSDEVVFNAPGTYSFDPAVFPSNQQEFTIEVWGGGGGGGGVYYDTATNGVVKGGGGGAGGYAKVVVDVDAVPSLATCVQNDLPSCPNLIALQVGAGGTLGDSSSQSLGATTAATAGALSRICVGGNNVNSCAGYLFTGNGGAAGGTRSYTGTPAGAAGAGGTVMASGNTNVDVVATATGVAGQAGSAGGLGGSGNQGIGKGGNGASVTVQGGIANPQNAATNGGSGRVKISWD